jgi:tetratricopeptide (TPR) repeat protein
MGSVVRAFVVRPFGVKENINFDEVHRQLIGPALVACGIQGGTTEPFLQAGNIRADMFQQLLVADLVVADISIHNANVFYELGIRHALQPQRTFLLRARSKKDREHCGLQDEVPFDLKTDRYLEYDSDRPAEKLEILKEALRQTLASEKPDSPVFQMLPNLEAQDRSRYLPVPQSFRDDVELAFEGKQIGLLGLLAMEARDFFWASEGLRLIGRAQFDLKAFAQARSTWEELHSLDPSAPEPNLRLGTIYQRLGDLSASGQALDRVAKNAETSPADRAEALSLLGRNIKDGWRRAWAGFSGTQAAIAALDTPELLRACQQYRQAFQEDLDSFYPGLNALSLLTIAIELAKSLADVWTSRFDTGEQAAAELASLQAQRQKLVGAVGVSLDAARQRARRSGTKDRWLDISAADYLFLTSDKPKRVAFAYKSALEGAPDFYTDAAKAQVQLFQQLGVLTENAQEVLGTFQTGAGAPQQPQAAPARVVLFTGHMIDAGRERPRFPDSLRDRARAAIRDKLKQEIARTEGPVIGIASGANGGDLLFHEICDELRIEHRLYLPLPPDMFRNESVSPAGRYWEDRFDAVLKQCPWSCLTSKPSLPAWLSVKSSYTAWQRANLWLVQEALAVGAKNFTLLALWDGNKTEGIGGTYHMRTVAEQYGAALATVYTTDLLKAEGASA